MCKIETFNFYKVPKNGILKKDFADFRQNGEIYAA